MTDYPNRRFVLSGLLALAGGPAIAGAPERSPLPVLRGGTPIRPAPSPAAGLIASANLGGAVAYQVVNAETGEIVEEHQPGLRLPPASVTKAATAHYAIDRLGPAHRFETRLVATGPVEAGQIKGDLILQGTGDPTLDTDALGTMIAALKDGGVHGVTGTLRVDTGSFPSLPHIDPDQPEHVGYNPAISGLNLNFNRVHFEWKKAGSDYDITMQARARKFRPGVSIAQMEIVDRKAPVYDYDQERGVDYWSVARGALGREGARWLPIRRPAAYASEVFRTLARSHGIDIRKGDDGVPGRGDVLVRHESVALDEMLRGMLKHSTNLTAETVGLAASRAAGARPASLIRSAREMNLWYNRSLGATSCGFVDHSGLGYGARISPADMVHVLMAAGTSGALKPILKPFRVEDAGVEVSAKTGTLNFVSGLAGFIDAKGAPPLAFAIFTADMPRRDAIDVEQRERPPGARGWSRRSRTLQKRLISRWVSLATA